MKHTLLFLLALLLALPVAAQTYTGALTTASPRYNRAYSTTQLSGVGFMAYYQSFRVRITMEGSYSFTANSNFDSFGSLYSSAGFLPSAALTNLLQVDDDSGSNGNFLLTQTLAVGTYTFVFSTYGNGFTGPFTVVVTGPALAPLPVELVRFTAEAQGAGAQLRWATASEKNSAYFAVESSADGRAFRELARVDAHGTTSQPREYAFADAGLARYGTPTVYYRLRQVDRDGSSAYSPVQAVLASKEALSFYPNPVAGTATFTSPVATTLTVRDALGRTAQVLHLAAGQQAVDLSALPAGVFLLTDEATHHTTRLVKAGY